jgi:hypothetical protein
MQTVKGEVFPTDTMKAYRWYTGTTPLILNLTLNGVEWSTNMPWPLFPQGKLASHRLNKRVGQPQSQAGPFGEQKNPLYLTIYESWAVQPTA